jgi:ELWxxDGT repeat protein
VNNIAVSQTSFILGDSSSVFVHETQDLGGQSRSNRLWHYNPATGEAFLLKTYTGSESTKPAFLNGRLYFSVTDSAGHEPWVSDGTVAGTHMLKDIEARTTASASPDELVAIGSEVFFVANDGTTSRELWKSDGTGAGTKQLVDLLSSPAYSAPTKLTAFNGMLYFFGLNATLSPTFWSVRPDGSSLTSLASLRPPTDKAPYFATACNASVAATVGATMYFSASSLLYRTDGTAAGTTRVAAATPYGEPCELTTLGGRVYFSADGGPNGGGRELWSSDGTSAGTVRVADILSGSAGSSPTQLAAIGQTLFFAATDAAGPRIFKSDGTAAGTVPLDSVPHSEPWLSVSRLMPVGATLFFLVKVDAPSTVPEVAQFQLWKTDGTAAGTIRVGDSITARRNATRGIGNRLYFTSSSAATGIEPWIVDSSGARLLEDLNAGGDSDPSWFANFNDIALFEARNADGASGLWRSSVVLPTPKLLGEIDSSPISVKYHPNRVIAGGKFFFVSESESLGSELHVVENESPAAVADGARATSGVETIIAVDGNDADPDGAVDPAGIRITTHPANGVASVVNGHIAYRSTAGFVGTDTLNYTIDDDQGQTSAPAPVTITVEAAPAVSPPSPSPPSGGSRGGGGAADLLLLLALAVPRFNRVRWSARVENEVQ